MNKRNVLLKVYQEQNKKVLRKLDKGGMFKSFDEEEQAKIQGAGMLADGAVDIISPMDKYGTRSRGGAAASGAVKGAMAGAALGPAGMAGGAVIGAAVSLIGNKKALEAKQQLLTDTSEADAKARAERAERRVASDATLTYGRQASRMYKYGGTVMGKPAGKFNLSMSIPKSVGVAPDLMPDIAISPNKMASREMGGNLPDDPIKKAQMAKVKPRPYQPDITLPGWDGLVEKSDGSIGMWGNDITPGQKTVIPKVETPLGKTDHNGRQSGHVYQGTTAVRDKIFEMEKKLKAGSNMKGYREGGVLPTSSTTSEVKGPKHEQGGVKLPEHGVEVEGGESIAGDFVFSDALGFAEIHNRIGKGMGKNEKRPETVLNKKTAVALKRKEGFLKIYQEEAKRKAGLPNEIDNTITELKGGQATRPMVMRNGGTMPKMQDGGKIRAKVNGVWKYITAEEKAAIDARAATNAARVTQGGNPRVQGKTNFSRLADGVSDLFERKPTSYPTSVPKAAPKRVWEDMPGRKTPTRAQRDSTEQKDNPFGDNILNKIDNALFGSDNVLNKTYDKPAPVVKKAGVTKAAPAPVVKTTPTGGSRVKENGVWRNVTDAEAEQVKSRFKDDAAKQKAKIDALPSYKPSNESPFKRITDALKNDGRYVKFENRLMDVAPPAYRQGKAADKISSTPPPARTDPDTGKPVPSESTSTSTAAPKRSGSGGKGKPTVKATTFERGPQIDLVSKEQQWTKPAAGEGIKLELPGTTTAIGLPPENAAPGQSNGKTKLGDALGALAPFASNIANAFRKLPSPPKPVMDDEIDPSLINLDASRSEAVRQRRGADKTAAQTLNGNNAVAATKAANLTAQMREMNDINQTEQNTNTQIKNQAQGVNAQIKRGNNLKQDYFNTQQVERQLKQQQLSADNMADVGNKMQAISRDKAAAALDDDKMLLTIAQDDTGATIRAGDAVLKRRLSPDGYKAIRELGARMEASNAEDRRLLRAQMNAILDNTRASTETILADRKTKEGLLKDEYTKARTNKANK